MTRCLCLYLGLGLGLRFFESRTCMDPGSAHPGYRATRHGQDPTTMRSRIGKTFHIVGKQDQYVFIYETLLEGLFCGPTHIPSGSFHGAYQHIKETFMQEQLNTLNALLPLLPKDKANMGHDPTDSKNVHSLVIPGPIQITKDEDDNEYVSVSSWQGQDGRYLVTNAPKYKTVSDFWRMMYDYKSYTIVMLNAEDTNNKALGSYIPRQREVPTNFGQFVVELLSTEHCDYVTKRKLHLTKGNGKPREIHQLQYLDWPMDLQKPYSLDTFFQLCSDVEVAQQDHQDNVITVHCLDGRSRTGCFCAIDSTIKMINEESIVDVYQTVKKIKSVSPSLIHTQEHYELCYEMAKITVNSLQVHV